MSEPLPVQPLSYATFDADGLPPYVAEAEALIDTRAKPRKLRRYFIKSDDAARYFLKSMRRRKSLESVGHRCEVCGGDSRGLVTPVDWGVSMPAKTLEFRFSSKEKPYFFRTHHAVCVTCWNRWRLRLIRLRWATRVQQALGWLIFLPIIFGRTLMNTARFWPYRNTVWAVWWAAFVVVFALKPLFRWLHRYNTPPTIRQALPPTLRLRQLERPIVKATGASL